MTTRQDIIPYSNYTSLISNLVTSKIYVIPRHVDIFMFHSLFVLNVMMKVEKSCILLTFVIFYIQYEVNIIDGKPLFTN